MFEKFTEKARRVIFFARYEASNFGSSSIGIEHLLLGVLRESRWPQHFVGVGKAQLLEELLRKEVPVRERIPTSVDLPFSAEAREALQLCAEEAQRSGSISIASEHILLGLLRQENPISQRVLQEIGATLDAVQADIAQWL